MIKTIANLLEELRKQEIAVLKSYKLQHGPMIGDMYEGLTRHLLDRSLFSNLELRVVGGKIRNSKGDLSHEIDCMIVEGNCEKIPYTQHYLCDVERVIAIVEVKKNLYSTELGDSLALMRDLVTRVYEPHEMKSTLFRDAWAGLMRSEPPRRDHLERHNLLEQTMFHHLMVAANLPLRIILGYEGFASEHGMREGFAGHMERQLREGTKSLGPLTLPNQIICRDHSILKLDGMPFIGRIDDDEWQCLATSKKQPAKLLLELLWTRLSYRFGLGAEMFGDDLGVEQLNAFMTARLCVEADRVAGWIFRYQALSKAALEEEPLEDGEWAPAFLTEAQSAIVHELCVREHVDITDPALATFLHEKGTNVDELIADLRMKDLAYARDGQLRLLTKQCRCAILPGGQFIAGENHSGRFDRWVARYLETRRTIN